MPRRWILVLGAAFLLGVGGWWLSRASSIRDLARRIQIGQTEEDVERLLGEPLAQLSSAGGNQTYGYGDLSRLELMARALIGESLGIDTLDLERHLPVRIEYDGEFRVTQVHINEQ